MIMVYRKKETVKGEKPSALFDTEASVIPGIRVREIKAVSLIGKTHIPGFDYVINPYIGCCHKCAYCYAAYMDEYDPHQDPWGSYIDVRMCEDPLSVSKLTGKSIFISSITDPYNPTEKHYKQMRRILDELSHIECSIEISTKSDLVVRDIDLLRRQSDISVFLSLNTLDDHFRSDMDEASSVDERLYALQQLHDNGIKTGINVSPIFPELTDPEAIVNATSNFVDCYMFEDLQLRPPYKYDILRYIRGKHPHIYDIYEDIYIEGDRSYFDFLENEIADMCSKQGIKHTLAFHHGKANRTIKQQLRDDPFGGDSLFKM